MGTVVKGTALAFVAKITAMIGGFLKVFTPNMTFTVNGAPLTQGQIVQKLQGFVATIGKVPQTKAAWRAAVAAKNAEHPVAKALLAQLTTMLKQTLGDMDAQLPDFGIEPPKPRAKPSVEKAAVAVGKRRGTRQVRGTKGRKQAEAITTTGTPGLALMGADGAVVPGALTGPTLPGAAEPSEVHGASASGTGAGSGGSGSSGTPPGK